MHKCQIEATISKDKALTIKGLPFQAGDKVDVIVESCKHQKVSSKKYPLKGKPINYVDPFACVSEKDWEVLK
ncbi:MAG: hypothetical protein ACUZ8O_05220 [Candidatus Anammoxibacter sp.]